jgi:3-dehydroquinate dehydratase-1
MSGIKNSSDLRGKPQIVGAVASPAALRRALRIQPGQVDLIELRVDNFSDNPETLLAAAPKLRVPLIVTVRHPAEGGVNDLGFVRRAELYAQFLPLATYLDIELRSLAKLAGTVPAARAAGVRVIASFHDFKATPSAAKLRQIIHAAHRAGADICKIAARADTPAAFARLLAPLAEKQPLPLSVMGMGEFGKISRLALAQAGSVLNYGYLAQANASGQWEATLLKQRLAELSEE